VIRVACHFEEISGDEKSCTMDTYPTDFSLPLEMTRGTAAYGDDSSRIAQIGSKKLYAVDATLSNVYFDFAEMEGSGYDNQLQTLDLFMKGLSRSRYVFFSSLPTLQALATNSPTPQ
jgi:hypothetical protein